MNREIKFELWDVKNKMMIRYEDEIGDDISMCPFTGSLYKDYALCFDNDREVEYIKRQFTGLKDKSSLIDIYEGDIISTRGEIIGNIYETDAEIYKAGNVLKSGFACIVEGLGTSKWRDTEQRLLECGCKYAE